MSINAATLRCNVSTAGLFGLAASYSQGSRGSSSGFQQTL